MNVEAKAALDERDAVIAVQADESERLRAEVADRVVEGVGRTDVVDGAPAFEVDGQRDADGREAGDAVVEVEGSLERMREKRVRSVPRLEAHDVVAVVHDQAETDVVLGQYVGAVDAEKSLLIDGRPKQMRVHAVAAD